MKKISIRIAAIVCALATLCILTVSAGAAGGTVSYFGESGKFVFEPGSRHSPTDLFTEYKGVMPGDVIKQEITVKNASSNGVKVKLYVRSLGSDESSVEFLSKLHLSVAKSENNKMEYMFDAAADQTDGMTDWVFLGTLFSGGKVNLVLNLEVPIELGNDFQDKIGMISWEFKVEELPIDPEDPQPTGDYSHLVMWLLLAAVPCVVIAALISKRRREEND